jgi:mono/diheme cytochrome c family protein
MRRKIRLALTATAGVVTLSIAVLAVYVAQTWDRVWDAPLPAVHRSADPEVIRRGAYLVNGPAHCVLCHSDSIDTAERLMAEGRPVPLVGGARFAAPPLGVVYSKNLTPDPETGIGRYSDEQIARLLRWGVRPNGRAVIQLFMPYDGMSDADLTAIISYLRVQAPVRHEVPANDITLIGKVVKSLLSVFKPRTSVHPADTVPDSPRARGEYLARHVANCGGCHTKRDPLTFSAKAPEFSGGAEMAPEKRSGTDLSVWFRTPNLTPAAGSALTKFPDRETFIARFQRGGHHYQGSPMPWVPFGRMSTEDLSALYDYLHSLAPQAGPTGEPTFVKGKEPQEVDRRARVAN